jgi:acetyl-CoA C-acetyltransferase
MGVDPRAPVVIGQSQLSWRDQEPAEPIDLMTLTLEAALADTGRPAPVRGQIRKVACPAGIWPYRNPARLVAERCGLRDVTTALTRFGGNEVYDLMSSSMAAIADGSLDAVVICSAETLHTRRRDRKAGEDRYLPEAMPARPDELVGGVDTGDETLPWWMDRWNDAVQFYAMAETAIRHRNGESPAEHLHRVARLWSSFARAARENPTAWIRSGATPEEIATVGPANRLVAYPYRKLMTANPDVDQAACVILCSADVAAGAGVDRDRWVFPWSASRGRDRDPTTRWRLDESPAMRIAGSTALELADLEVDDCELIDIYSCFPSAVQVAQRELGIGDRALTVTGGTTFSGGPPNSYGLHAAARTVELIRDVPERQALISGVGGLLTKHSYLVFSGAPNGRAFHLAHPQTAIDTFPGRTGPALLPAPATLEAYTMTYDHDATPEGAVLSCLTDDGSRVWGAPSEIEALAALTRDDLCGRRVQLELSHRGDRIPVAHLI